MKRLSVMVCLLFFLTGCFGGEQEMERGMRLRKELLAAESCQFEADITADYGDKLYTFGMDCKGDPHGDLEFTVTEPDSISGISGKLQGQRGSITFSDTALYYPLITDDLLSPISAPWIFLKTLRSGYITSTVTEGELLHLTVDDSYADDALQLDIWLDSDNKPVRSDILWRGQRYLSLEVKNFQIL